MKVKGAANGGFLGGFAPGELDGVVIFESEKD
jgi:hypothetical protein